MVDEDLVVQTHVSDEPSRVAYWLAIAFIFIIPWEAGARVPGIGQISKPLGLLLAAAWVLGALGHGRVRRPVAIHAAYLAFLVWSGITVFWSLDPDATFGGVVTYMQLFGLLVIMWDLFDRRSRIEAALLAYVLGAYISAGAIISTFLTAAVERFPAHQRFYALGFEVDGIALIVATAIPAACYLATGPSASSRSPLIRLLGVVYIPIAVFAVVLTGTRGATLASVPTLVYVIASLRRTGPIVRVTAVGALVVAAALVANLAPQGMIERIGSIGHELTGSGDATGNYGEGNIGGRAVTWSESLGAFIERPFTGVGVSAHRSAIVLGKEAHNVYLSVLTETGVFGFLLFTAVLASLFMSVLRQPRRLRHYWFTQLAVLAIEGMTLSLEDDKTVWIFAILAVASTVAIEDVPFDGAATAREPAPLPGEAIRSRGHGWSYA